MQEQAIILITANRGIGKTFFVLSMLDSISKGIPFGPWPVRNPVPGLYHDAELTPQDLQERLRRMGGATRVEPLYVLSDGIVTEKGHLPKGNLQSPTWRSAMKGLLLELGVKVWALDNIASASAGTSEENSADAWRDVNRWFIELRFAGITSILIHHTGKSGEQRGTHSREDNVDVSLMLKRPKGYTLTDGALFNVIFTKTRLSTSDLAKVSDVQFRLIEDPIWGYVWKTKRPKRDRLTEILRLTDEGFSQSAIGESIGCSRQNVSAYIQRLKANGSLTDKGKLTEAGLNRLKEPFSGLGDS